MRLPKILIAGAGIGGLTAALALLQRGFPVALVEQAKEVGDLGAGVQLAADGTRVLLALGLQEAMEAVAGEAAWKEVRLWDSGERRKLFDLDADSRTRFGAPYWFVHRGDLHRVLRQAVQRLAPDAIRTDARCVSLEQDESGVRLTLATGEVVEGDVLVGADGVHSAVRGALFESPVATFAGIIAWRGLVPMARVPAELRQNVGTNWVGPGGHVITYPVRRGALMNFAAFAERDDWQVESWSIEGSRDELARDFSGWHPLIHALIAAIDTPYKWALVQRDPLPRWTRGRVTLLGDAAHPTLPFLAHGAIMALEDGIVLARCLAVQPDDPAAALARYERLRMPRTTAIVEGSAANLRRFHNPDLADAAKAVAYLDREWAPEKVRSRYDWMFEYDATTVPLGSADVDAAPAVRAT